MCDIDRFCDICAEDGVSAAIQGLPFGANLLELANACRRNAEQVRAQGNQARANRLLSAAQYLAYLDCPYDGVVQQMASQSQKSAEMETNRGILNCPLLPEIVPLPHDDCLGRSSLSLSIIGGETLNLWSVGSATEVDSAGELTLQLRPHQSVVIGRQEGGRIEYLDPLYQPTQLLPNSSHSVVNAREANNWLSRGHFMLIGALNGIVLVNGVPRRGGGIRPPLNGTVMLEPECRRMREGENYMIERGKSAKIRLPNGTVILLSSTARH